MEMSVLTIFFIVLSLLILVVYLVLLARLLSSWSRITSINEDFSGSVSVIIPFRNEVGNLKRLTHFLNKIKHTDFEVIFVDDHSNDGSLDELLQLLTKTLINFRVISLEKNEGKKAALSHGIEEANGEIILTTDADCIMDKNWLQAMTAPFVSSKIKMVAGPVSYLRRGAWSKLMAIEFQALIGVSGAMIQRDKPTMANGANLAFRKSVFLELNGYKDISATPSGDDELLMHKFHIAYPGSIAFTKTADALVGTLAPENWKALVSQRTRWASKWRVGKRKSTMALATLVGSVQIAVILLVITSIITDQFELLGVVLFTKFFLEFVFTSKTAKDIGASRPHIGLFVLSFIIYPFYALYIALVANFGGYRWKGRSYK